MIDVAELYRQMLRARGFELLLADLWQRGLVSGELHLGTGEEAIAAGVVGHLRDGDALALDHRSTPPLVVRGVDPVALAREMLGKPDGLCGGRGGHMHLFSAPHLAASSGIVGAAAPAAVGFALAAARLRSAAVAVGFFGDGAFNQGMVLESLNLAATWRLPVLFVCKVNGWAITTRSADVTAGDLAERARGSGVPARAVDGARVEDVWRAAGEALGRGRAGEGPSVLLCACPRLDGHFLGDPLLVAARHPLGEGRATLRKVVGAALSDAGGGLAERAGAMRRMTGAMLGARGPRRGDRGDPVEVARRTLDLAEGDRRRIELAVEEEMAEVRRRALADGEAGHA